MLFTKFLHAVYLKQKISLIIILWVDIEPDEKKLIVQKHLIALRVGIHDHKKNNNLNVARIFL